ncbi:hypothetical protein [Leptospira phage LE3]|uniref:Uncharacterized protein n=2 Tax=Nylescharonvirus TaxID=2843431 RepID=A0A343LEB4_9CAUD|nr:hypothetical protein HWB33_gp13 [Leptospira phage LE3]YP_009835486.1 hypothetical protein HWB34_gp11 [Leptospira phage LE4]ATN94981.1 hypothetical protein [Leptospira phage LE3]ATN95024.1 hypothetical protein [Leptospira phage LE4]
MKKQIVKIFKDKPYEIWKYIKGKAQFEIDPKFVWNLILFSIFISNFFWIQFLSMKIDKLQAKLTLLNIAIDYYKGK